MNRHWPGSVDLTMEKLFFDNWSVVARTLLIGVLAYASLIGLLRMSGKRTLSKMNAFDLIVTVALGSTLASMLTSKDVALVQGVLAFAMLIGMQFAITWLSVRARWVRQWTTGEPSLLVYDGQPLPDAMRKLRVTQVELHAAVREAGLSALDGVQAVVLETNGTLSVVSRGEGGRSTVDEVRRIGEKAERNQQE
jgi:uncharacterized membrane protein YcaP (DUF421 family)